MKAIISSDNYQKDSPIETITENNIKVLLLESSCIEIKKLFEKQGFIVIKLINMNTILGIYYKY